MDIDNDSHRLTRLTVVDTGRRRRWRDEEKIRIVEESLGGHHQGSATARRYGIANEQIFSWRKAYREGRLGKQPPAGFVPAVVIPEAGTSPAPPAAMTRSGRMEIVVGRDRRVIVGPDVDAAALSRVLDVLEQR
jgi:transposase